MENNYCNYGSYWKEPDLTGRTWVLLGGPGLTGRTWSYWEDLVLLECSGWSAVPEVVPLLRGFSRVLLGPGGAEKTSTLYTSHGSSAPLYPGPLFTEQVGGWALAQGLWPLGIEPRTIQLGVAPTLPYPALHNPSNL